MNKNFIIPLGFVGLGLILFGFRKKTDDVDLTYMETKTDEIMNVLNKNLSFSDTQISTLAKQIKEQEAGDYNKHVQVRTWKGLMSLEIESQLQDSESLDIGLMNQIAQGLEKAVDVVMKSGKTAISALCMANGYEVTSTIYTIENNLIKLSKVI